MITVIVGANRFSGVLKSYEREGDDLLINFELSKYEKISLILPKFPETMFKIMSVSTIDKIRDCTIDMNKGVIKFGKNVIYEATPSDIKNDIKKLKESAQKVEGKITKG